MCEEVEGPRLSPFFIRGRGRALWGTLVWGRTFLPPSLSKRTQDRTFLFVVLVGGRFVAFLLLIKVATSLATRRGCRPARTGLGTQDRFRSGGFKVFLR